VILLGALCGKDVFPQELISGVQDYDEINELIETFVERLEN